MNNLNNIFFPIRKTQVAVEGRNISRYYAIVDQDKTFLGIKKDKHYCISNEDALQEGFQIYQKLTNTQGELIKAFGNPQRNWCTLLIQGYNLKEYILQKKLSDAKQHMLFEQPIEKEEIFKKNKFIDLFNTFPEHLRQKVLQEKFANLDIIIAVVNGYDIDDHLNFYLIINWKHNQHLKLLSIDRRSILDSHKVANEFSKSLEDFIIHYMNCSNVRLSEESFIPVLYDIYNLNTSPTTIENDDNHREKLSNFEKSCRLYYEENETGMYSSFIDFIIQHNLYDPTDQDINKWRRIKEIISVNQVYTGTKSRFKTILKNETKRNQYEKDHQFNYKSFRHLLNV